MSESLIIENGPAGGGRVAGRIDVDNASTALARGIALYAVGKSVNADLSGLDSADSVTLAVLLAWAVRARKSGGTLTFTGASSRLQAIAHLGDAEPLLGFSQYEEGAPKRNTPA